MYLSTYYCASEAGITVTGNDINKFSSTVVVHKIQCFISVALLVREWKVENS